MNTSGYLKELQKVITREKPLVVNKQPCCFYENGSWIVIPSYTFTLKHKETLTIDGERMVWLHIDGIARSISLAWTAFNEEIELIKDQENKIKDPILIIHGNWTV